MSKSNDRLSDTMLILQESVKKMHITDEGWIQIVSEIDAIHIFDQIEDFRQPGKVEYRLPELLTMILCAALREGDCSYSSIADHIRACRHEYHRLGLLKSAERTPSHDIIRYVLMSLNSEFLIDTVIRAFYTFFESLYEKAGDDRLIHIMMDGKEIRGTGRSIKTAAPCRNVNMMNIYYGSHKLCISSDPVDDKTNEIPAAQSALKMLYLKGAVVTADALHCQKETCQIIVDGKGEYVLPVKRNHPGLYDEVEKHFNNPENAEKMEEIKREKRTFWIYKLPSKYRPEGYESARCFIKMVSNCHSNKETTEMNFISSTLDKSAVIEAIECRWGIENELHQTKDSSFLQEDRIQYQNRNALKNMAMLNNLAVSLARIVQAFEPNMPLKMAKKYLRNYPYQILKLITEMVQPGDLMNRVMKGAVGSRKKIKSQNK